VLDTQGNRVQGDLGEKPGEDQHAKPQRVVVCVLPVAAVQLRQQVQDGQAEQVGSRKRIQNPDVLRVV
jgi:hypothetical protein